MTVSATRQTVATTRVTRVRGDQVRERSDQLAGEEPLEIRAAGPGQDAVRVAVTMRTPGHDFALAAGFLITEGLVPADGIAAVGYCEDPDAQQYNVVTVRTRAAFDIGVAERHFFASSSCGICGKAALDAVSVRCAPVPDGPVVDRDVIVGLPDTLRERQRVFARTGGLHAAGLFTADGTLLRLHEDVGRHNAVDKIVGAVALEGGDRGTILLVSGRLSFEIVQKCAVGGVPILCAISAPSTLAVSAAEALGLTTVGFLRGDGFNVYTHPARIDLQAGAA